MEAVEGTSGSRGILPRIARIGIGKGRINTVVQARRNLKKRAKLLHCPHRSKRSAGHAGRPVLTPWSPLRTARRSWSARIWRAALRRQHGSRGPRPISPGLSSGMGAIQGWIPILARLSYSAVEVSLSMMGPCNSAVESSPFSCRIFLASPGLWKFSSAG